MKHCPGAPSDFQKARLARTVPSLFSNSNPQLFELKHYAMAKFKIPEDEVNRMRVALLAAFDATIAEVETDEWDQVRLDGSNLQYMVGYVLRDRGREVCGQIEDGKFKNAAT